MEEVEIKDECLLDIYTPEKIIEDLSSKEDSTKDILDLINKTIPSVIKLKKLSKIFTSLSNCDHLAFIEITKSKNRNLRTISTFLIFSKMCEWCKEGLNFEIVSSLYKEVFLVRYRDVDPNIRGLCVDFITDWITISPTVFCNNNYLKYLGLYLNDKSDLVRKKALNGFIKLIEKNLDMKEILDKNIKRIKEMSSKDKNSNIREEASRLILISYNRKLISKENVFEVLKRGIKDVKLMNKTIWVVLKDVTNGSSKGGTNDSSKGGTNDNNGTNGSSKGGPNDNNGPNDSSKGGTNSGKNHNNKKEKKIIYENQSIIPYFEALHQLYSKTSHVPFEHFIFDRQDLDFFVQYTVQSHEESEFCCEKQTNCYLEILSVLKLERVAHALTLFKTFRNSLENMRIIFKCVLDLSLETFKNEIKLTIRLLDDFFEFVLANKSRLNNGERLNNGGRLNNGERLNNGDKVERLDNIDKVEPLDKVESFNKIEYKTTSLNKKTPLDKTHLIQIILNTFFLILKKLEEDFESKVGLFLERSQGDIFLRFYAIRSFDLSSFITEEDYTETKIYSSLWNILNKKFDKIEEISFYCHLDLREICELLFFVNGKVCTKEGDNNHDKDIKHCFDEESALKVLNYKIKEYIRQNITSLLTQGGLPYFFRFIEENVLIDLFYLSFLVMDLDTFRVLLSRLKNKDKVIEQYFVFLEQFYELIDSKSGKIMVDKLSSMLDGIERIVHDDKECRESLQDNKDGNGKQYEHDKIDIGKQDKNTHYHNNFLLDDQLLINSTLISELSSIKGSSLNVFSHVGESLITTNSELDTPQVERRCINIDPNEIQQTDNNVYAFSTLLKTKITTNGLIFKSLKRMIEKNSEKLYDTVCVHFVIHLNSNECIILDSKLKTKSKFKMMLGKKCRDPTVMTSENTTYL